MSFWSFYQQQLVPCFLAFRPLLRFSVSTSSCTFLPISWRGISPFGAHLDVVLILRLDLPLRSHCFVVLFRRYPLLIQYIIAIIYLNPQQSLKTRAWPIPPIPKPCEKRLRAEPQEAKRMRKEAKLRPQQKDFFQLFLLNIKESVLLKFPTWIPIKTH